MLVGSDRPTDRQTMSLIELSWTAKKSSTTVHLKTRFMQISCVLGMGESLKMKMTQLKCEYILQVLVGLVQCVAQVKHGDRFFIAAQFVSDYLSVWP